MHTLWSDCSWIDLHLGDSGCKGLIDIKEEVATDLNSCFNSCRQAALEHTTKSTADVQFAHVVYAFVRGNNSPHQKMSSACI